MQQALLAAFPDAEDAASQRVEFVRAPGRVNLMGDHTDYNDGLVLPGAIDLDTWIALRRRRDGLVRIDSLQAGGEARSFWIEDLATPAPEAGGPDGAAPRGDWLDYVAGMAWSLREADLPARGFDGIVDSTLPPAAGLASSAALELAVAQALLGAAPGGAPPHYPAAYLASLAQRAEREYVGVNCGLMDQFVSASGRAGHAVLLDCRSLDSGYVALPPGLAVVVCDTGAPRELRASAYNERRAECARAVTLLAERKPTISSLRDVDVATLHRLRAALPPALARRAEHVVRENDRVRSAARALETADLEALGAIFAASHASLRDDFEVSSPALDDMVEIAAGVPGVVGARMTGAGFGGCTVTLVREGAVAELREAVERDYPKRTGLRPKVYEVSLADGAGRA